MKQKPGLKMPKFVLLLALLLTGALGTKAQDLSVNGNIRDRNGAAVIGATIKAAGEASIGTTSDLDGNFSLKVPGTVKQLIISYIGMQTQKVDVKAGKPIYVVLQDDSRNLNEVVVIGYQTVKRRDLTGSVASVSGKAIAETPVSNIGQALQGKLPGVNVVTQDGRPNASLSIRVRGGSSISQSNEPLIILDGMIVGSLSDIPADQVESVDVLKDASSTAIYGARGANGVILVTTKSPKTGQTTVSYNGYAKFNTPTKYLKALSPYDYLKYVWANADANGTAYRTPFEQLYGLGTYTSTNPGGIESYRNLKSDDIQKDVYNQSFTHNHDLTVAAGAEKTKVLFSVNYLDDQGMKINSYSKRGNVSLKIDQKLTKDLDIKVDTRYTDLVNLGNDAVILSTSYRFRPISTEHILGDLGQLQEGNLENYGKQSSWDTYSPYSRIKDYEPLATSRNFRGLFSLNWKIIPGLTYHTDFNANRKWDQNKTWAGAIYNNYLDPATGEKQYAGSVDLERTDSWGLRWSNTLLYDFNINKIHKFNVLLGQEFSQSSGSGMRISANHFPSNFTKENAFGLVDQYDKTAGTSSFSTSISIPGHLQSYFGRLNYSLLDRYLLTFTFRADGSSNFAPKHRWASFPGAAAAWRISDESFMKDIDWLDNLKLRASYGSSGSDNINSSEWSQVWTTATDKRNQYVINNSYLPSYGLYSQNLANTALIWETNVTRNIGADFGLFKNRISGTVEYYKNVTKDLLLQTSIAGITGFTSTVANVGQLSNKGLEISLSGSVLKSKNWNISAGGNINFNKSNVDKLASNVTGLYGTKWASSSTYPINDYILQEGSPVGLVRGLVYDGFYTADDFTYDNGVYKLKSGVPDVGNFIGPLHGVATNQRPAGQTAFPGVVKYKDLDGNGVINDLDLQVIGNMNPKHTGGFNFSASFKNVDLGAYFNWSYGNDIYNLTKLSSLYGYKETGVYENKLEILNNSYKLYDVVNGQLVRFNTPEELNAANVNATLPLAYNENGVTSSLGIEDGSYLRLNTLSLGYTVPKQFSKKAGVNTLRIYGSIYNVCTISGYSGLDPEVNSEPALNHATYPTPGLDWNTYPRARSFVLGLNVKF